MRAMEFLKGIGILVFTPIVIILSILWTAFMIWPLICIGLIVVFAVALLSHAAAWILFGLMVLFLVLYVIAKTF